MLLNFARRDVVTIAPEETVARAAEKLTNHDVGCLVVIEGNRPVGILTDRDIVVRTVCPGLDAQAITVGEVMSRRPVLLEEDLGLFEALEIVRDQAVRRFPVVNGDGDLTGIFTVDDVIYLLGLELSAVARIIDSENR